MKNIVHSFLHAGRQSPLQMRQKRREALKEADCIILAGAVCDFRLSYGRVLGRRAKIIAVNRNKAELYKVVCVFNWYGVLFLSLTFTE